MVSTLQKGTVLVTWKKLITEKFDMCVITLKVKKEIKIKRMINSTDKLFDPQLVSRYRPFDGSRRFNAVFTKSPHFSLYCVRLIWSSSGHDITLRSILVLPSHLLKPLSDILTKNVHALRFSPIYVKYTKWLNFEIHQLVWELFIF